VSVELVCSTVVTRQTYSDSNGFFKIQFGRATQDVAFADLSASFPGGGLPNQMNISDSVNSVSNLIPNLDTCEIRVSPVPGFSAEPISTHDFSGRFPTGNIGKIHLQPVGKIQGTSFSRTSSEAPQKVRQFYFKAQELVRKRSPEWKKALGELDRALALYPEYAAAWTLKGEIHRIRNEVEPAVIAYEKARKADPNYIFPYLSLARASAGRSRWKEVLDYTADLHGLGITTAETNYLEGLSYYYLGELQRAEDSLQLIDPQEAYSRYPLALLHLAIIHSVRGKVENALSEFDRYLEALPPEWIPQ